MLKPVLSLALAFLALPSAYASSACPEINGKFVHQKQTDKTIEIYTHRDGGKVSYIAHGGQEVLADGKMRNVSMSGTSVKLKASCKKNTLEIYMHTNNKTNILRITPFDAKKLNVEIIPGEGSGIYVLSEDEPAPLE